MENKEPSEILLKAKIKYYTRVETCTYWHVVLHALLKKRNNQT